MKSHPTLALLACATFLFAASATHAGSATWSLYPTSRDWNTAPNWTPNTVPNGPMDSATFGNSNTTTILLSTDIEVDGMAFQLDASTYTFRFAGSGQFIFSGAGIINDSGQTQTILQDESYHLVFSSAASAGDRVLIRSGQITFNDASRAGSASFDLIGSQIQFWDNSTASNGTFNNGGFEQPLRTLDTIGFNDQSSAGNGYFVNNGSSSSDLENNGYLYIDTGATAATATIINNASPISAGQPGDTSIFGTGGNAAFVANGSALPAGFGGSVQVYGQAGSGSYTANGGSNGGMGGRLFFSLGADGGSARCVVNGNGYLQLSTP